ncbi:MAG TPA: hypothetical protein VJU86_21065 [Pyrinomonadaceae bacterium]|nr:hypothetical protein [Pyrinomonadaceae bacterium]
MTFNKLFCLILVLGFSAFIVRGQAPAVSAASPASSITQEMRVAANEAYQKADWKSAAESYQKIASAEEKNVGARYRWGVSLLNLGRNLDAQKQLEVVFNASPNSVFALALARSYGRNRNKEKAFEVLERSLTLGGIAPETLVAEKDFAEWASEAQFKELARKSDLAVNPCKAKPEFRQFDFWIGDWNVKNPQGLTVGTSSVQLILGQCIIFENWTSGNGSSGKSFNLFDAKDGKWHQSWVDDKGTFTHYVGGWEDGKMVVVADTVVGGQKALAKMTFSKLPNGDVRQFGENSSDAGKTWTTAFDLTYVRK